MAEVTVAHHPELTAEGATGVFARHFSGKYEVYKTGFTARDFVVKKSGWTGVGVTLQQTRNATTFVFTGLHPSLLLPVLLALLGVIPYLVIFLAFVRPDWKAMEEEVRLFIETASEFA